MVILEYLLKSYSVMNGVLLRVCVTGALQGLSWCIYSSVMSFRYLEWFSHLLQTTSILLSPLQGIANLLSNWCLNLKVHCCRGRLP